MPVFKFSFPISNCRILTSRFLLLPVCLLALINPLQAQDEAARINTQQDVANRDQTAELQQKVQFRITDPELGEIDLVSRTPKPKMFTFSTNQNFNYTSNAFLVRNGEQDAFFYNGRFDASFVPYSVRDITPRITFEQNFFRYTRFSRLDFDSQSVIFDVKYDLNPEDTWFIDTSYALSRLYSPHSDTIGEFYKYGLANLSVTNVRQLGHTPIYAVGSAGVYYRHGESSAFDRVVPYFNAVFLYSPIENVQVSAFVRQELQFYTNDPLESSRTDFNLNLGAAVAWSPIEYVTLGATFSFVGNYSNSGPVEYHVFLPNILVAAQIAF